MAKEEPLWGEETRLAFSGTLPLGKAGLFLLCPGGEGLLSLSIFCGIFCGRRRS